MDTPLKKLALVGYGKMGRLIDQLAAQHGFEVVLRLNAGSNQAGAGLLPKALSQADVAIEFTSPEAVLSNLTALAKARMPTVTGTTGWFTSLDKVRDAFESANASLVYSPNFSIGVAVFRRLAGLAAELLRDEIEYGAWAWEIHHDAKKDAPSGTLLHLVRTMEEHGYRRKIDVSSNRAGMHPGTHEIGFDSSADTITLRHAARSRDGFAHGALRAARWILDHPGVHTFDEVLFGDHHQ